MPVPADSHEWVSFEDPDEERTWLIDVTFLSSSWTCIFGAGCQGVLTGPAPELVQGCCSYGAHFSSPEDLARVEAAAATLTDEEWQFRSVGAVEGFVTRDGEVAMTSLADDACIFLNRPGFSGGAGCAFHLAAMKRNVPHLELKPDVCWQLPLRREDLVDDLGHVTSTLTQWDRRHWGEAGDEFHWWCTESKSAFVGAKPVYVTLADELDALIGKRVARRVRAYLVEREKEGTLLPHPAVRRKKH